MDGASDAGDGVKPSTSPSPSPLDKPLSELTEEDIAQLTREDCRRFLKEKGMRRPSWNKSQAIQQVISLKALIEGRPGGGDCPAGPGILMKPLPSPAPETAAGVVAAAAVSSSGNSSQIGAPSPSEETAVRESQSPAQKEPCPYRRRDPAPPLFAAGVHLARIPSVGRDSQPPESCSYSQRTVGVTPAGQMTIFYDGKINVFEGVMPDQARTIMDVAASSGQSAEEATAPMLCRPPVPPFCLSFSGPSCQAPSQIAGRASHCTLDGMDEGSRVLRGNETEGPTTRKASVQRYLEKRKDRFKGKKVIVGSAPSGMEVLYLSQKFRCPNTNEPFSGTEASSVLSQPPGTTAKSNFIDDRSQRIRLSIDLNGDDGGGSS